MKTDTPRWIRLKTPGFEFGIVCLAGENDTDPISQIWKNAANEVLEIIKDQKRTLP